MAPAQPPVPDLSKATIGILGGSGLYAMEELRDVEELEVQTPFGSPSAVSYTHLTLPTT